MEAEERNVPRRIALDLVRMLILGPPRLFQTCSGRHIPGREILMHRSQLSKTTSSRTTSQGTRPHDNMAIGRTRLHALIVGLRSTSLILARRIGLPLLFLGAGLVLIRPCASQTETCTATGSLTNARANHTATLLADIKGLVGGGNDAVGRPLPLAVDALTFTDVSEAAGISEDNISWGAAWGDYDGDGYIDVFTVGHLYSICQLWHNNGDGTFTDVTTAAGLLTVDGDAHGPCWADLDNDGKLDLYVAKGTKLNEAYSWNDLWHNNGDGTFTNIAISSNVTGIGSNGRGPSAVDYDNDGDLDIFVASNFKDGVGDPNLLYRNDGGFQFTDVATEAGIAREGISNWAAAWTDYDLDGLIDVFISTPDSRRGGPPSSALYRNRGDGTFEDVSKAAGIDTGFANCGAWGDFNNDGYPDLYVTMDTGGILYRNNGDGTFTDVTQESGVINTDQALAANWGDYDNDGFQDLYIVNATAPNRLFQNKNGATFTDVAAAAGVTAKKGGEGMDASFIDYNNDGFLDLFVCNGLSGYGPYLLFKNNGNRNHWLKIELTGQKSNRDGVGARITLTAGTRTQYRQYVGQHFMAQNHIPVHFGLRGATTVRSIVIKWPSGVRQELDNIPADQTITVIEP